MKKFNQDYRRYSNTKPTLFRMLISIINNKVLRGLYYARVAENDGLLSKFFLRRSAKLLSLHGIEISSTKNIQGGLCIIHPYGITINSRSRIGKDFTIFKGATIGSIRSGLKKGTPTIGDRVTVCCNAFICGNINIGDDVLIAANSFVNFDVPSHSVVIGNPATVHHKNHPSEDYLPIQNESY